VQAYRAKIQTEGIENLFKEITAENQGKDMNIQIQTTYRTLNRHEQKRTSLCYTIVKMLSLWNKERTFKIAKEKHQLTYKGKFITIISDIFSRKPKSQEMV
jgi:hypothetical protein